MWHQDRKFESQSETAQKEEFLFRKKYFLK